MRTNQRLRRSELTATKFGRSFFIVTWSDNSGMDYLDIRLFQTNDTYKCHIFDSAEIDDIQHASGSGSGSVPTILKVPKIFS